MLPKRRNPALLAATLLLFIILAFFGALTFSTYLIPPDVIEKKIVEKIENFSQGDIEYGSFEYSRFPLPEVKFSHIRWMSEKNNQILLEADQLWVRLDILGAFLRRVEIGILEIERGKLALRFPESFPLDSFQITNLNSRIGPFRWGNSCKIKMGASLQDDESDFVGEGELSVPVFSKWDWDKVGWSIDFKVEALDLALFTDDSKWKTLTAVESGLFDGQFRFRKLPEDSWISLIGETDLRQVIYHIQTQTSLLRSEPLDAELGFEVQWNMTEEEVAMKAFSFQTPFGSVTGAGYGFLGTKEIKELQISASNIILEEVPRYLIPLKEAIPFNLGFSGQSSLELSVGGTLDHLSFNANWDFSSGLLTYGRYFVKPKDVPLNFTLDALVKDGEIFSGDFSAKLKGITVKGNLTDFDIESGNGQFNMITNKFALEAVQNYFPPFSDYEVSGEAKILLNFEGLLGNLSEIKSMLNLTLEGASFETQEGNGIKNAFLALDYGPVGVEVKQARFEINQSPCELDLTIYNLLQNPHVKMKLKSPYLSLTSTARVTEDMTSKWLGLEDRQRLERWSSWVRKTFPSGELVENVMAELEYRDKQWAVQNLEFQISEGWGRMQAGVDLNWDPAFFWADFGLNQINLEKFSSPLERGTYPLLGVLFLELQVQGEGLAFEGMDKRLHGQGSFSLTDGTLRSADLIKLLSTIQELSSIQELSRGKTDFDDLRFPFELKDGKISTEKLTMVSPEFMLEGSGETTVDGILNFRMDAFLSPELTNKYLGPVLGYHQISEGQQFGPVPILLAGPLSAPDLKLDPTLFPTLERDLLHGRSQKVLRNFLPEDFFFDRETNS
ncbi:MAG: hypothetical protein JW893_06720 [Candidatus Omnitrophica bacterium]|nr:hypothetical protein [Candidatus Omnitrophota bacterium]